MGKTQHIVQNALLEVPHPNVSIMQRCSVFPVEVVVRGFMTGMHDAGMLLIDTLEEVADTVMLGTATTLDVAQPRCPFH